MRKIDTEADRLLEDALRMIRVDSYRLAMVVLTYASCARALQVRLRLDHAAVRLPERLSDMKRKLEHAKLQLEEVDKRRKEQPREMGSLVLTAERQVTEAPAELDAGAQRKTSVVEENEQNKSSFTRMYWHKLFG